MFEPGDRVKIKGDQSNKAWTVLSYPWKCWHEKMVTIGDENGQERAVNVDDLEKVKEPAAQHGFSCNGDYCEIVREEMRLE